MLTAISTARGEANGAWGNEARKFMDDQWERLKESRGEANGEDEQNNAYNGEYDKAKRAIAKAIRRSNTMYYDHVRSGKVPEPDAVDSTS